jgi:Ca-activated chloride channel family protein
MSFGAPWALWALTLLPLAVGALMALRRRRVRTAVPLPNAAVLASVSPRRPRLRSMAPPLLFAGAFVVLVAGVARPQTTERLQTRPGTVVLTIDTSGSMHADDVVPTRLEAAKAQAAAFVRRLPADMAVGLVTYSSQAQVQVAPTADHGLVLSALEGLRADGGTALGEALAAAADLYAERAPADGARGNGGVLLLADGRNSAGSVTPADAMASAAARDVPVYTIALGTPQGVLRSFGGRIEQPVPPDPETLRRISEATGGLSFEAATESELERIYRDMSDRFVLEVPRVREVTWAFALAAIPLVLAALGLSLAMRGRFP